MQQLDHVGQYSARAPSTISPKPFRFGLRDWSAPGDLFYQWSSSGDQNNDRATTITGQYC